MQRVVSLDWVLVTERGVHAASGRAVIAAIVAVALAAAAAGLVWLARHGGEVATVAHAALPAPQPQPVTGRADQALPAPQHIHYHLHIEQSAITERRTS